MPTWSKPPVFVTCLFLVVVSCGKKAETELFDPALGMPDVVSSDPDLGTPAAETDPSGLAPAAPDVISVDPELGTPLIVRSTSGAPILLSVPPSDPGDPASVARAFYASYAQSYRLSNPGNDLEVVRVHADSGVFAKLGMTHVKMGQLYQGLPVFDSESVVHLTRRLGVSSVIGRTVPTPTIGVTPTLGPDQAVAIAAAQIPAETAAERAKIDHPTPQVEAGIYVPALFGGTGATRLAYRVVQSGYRSYVDAASGDVLLHYDTVAAMRDRKTYDTELSTVYPGPPTDADVPVLVEATDLSAGCPAGVDQQACDVHTSVGQCYDYFFDTFGADGWNGDPPWREIPLTAYVRLAVDGCPNAWASGTYIVMCDDYGYFYNVGHEYGHNIVSSAHISWPLDRDGGGLSEGFATIWGYMVMAPYYPDSAPDRGRVRVHYDIYSSRQDKDGHKMAMPFVAFKDLLVWGGVNIASVRVEQIGRDAATARDKTAYLLYHAMNDYLGSNDNMYSAASKIAQACQEIAQSGSDARLSDADCTQVNNALAAVGMMGTLAITSPMTEYSEKPDPNYSSAPVDYPYGETGLTPQVYPVSFDVAYEKAPYADPGTLRLVALDRATGAAPAVRWHLDPNDAYGSSKIVFEPALGAREVYATATFDNGFSATAVATVNVVNLPPEGGIDLPAEGVSVSTGVWIQVLGHASDPNQSSISSVGMDWNSSSSDNWTSTQGDSTWVMFGTPGQRTITLTLTDELGKTSQYSRNVAVTEETGGTPSAAIAGIDATLGGTTRNVPIACSLSSTGASRVSCVAAVPCLASVTLHAAEVPGGTYTYDWFFDAGGSAVNPVAIGSGAVVSWDVPTTVTNACRGGSGNITLRVTGNGGAAEQVLHLSLTNPPDFNDDGKADLVIEDDTAGRVYVQYMDGVTMGTSDVVNGLSLGYGSRVASVTDMNGDGKPDFVIEDGNAGRVYVQYMDGLTMGDVALVDGLVLPWGCRVASVTDMNSDGKPDFVIEDGNAGRVYVQYMDGLTMGEVALVDGLVLPWGCRVASVTDMNGDGRPDFVIEDGNAGRVYLQYMDGLTMGEVALVDGLVLPYGCRVASVTDMNSDGKPDFVVEDTYAGRVYVQHMDGATTEELQVVDGLVLGGGWNLVSVQ